MKRRKNKQLRPKRPNRYPFLWEQYLDERDFDWEFLAKGLQGGVKLFGYKGAIILRAGDAAQRARAQRPRKKSKK